MKPLVEEGDKRLTTATTPIDFNDPVIDTVQYANDLIKTLQYYGVYGLSANQIGDPYHCFAFGAGEFWTAMYNAEIIEQSEKKQYGKEGCISYPFIIMNIYRPQSIKVSFRDPKGALQVQDFDGITARTICQQIDLLEGRLFFERASDYEINRGYSRRKMIKKRALRQQRENKKLYKELNLSQEQIEAVERERYQRLPRKEKDYNINKEATQLSTGSNTITFTTD